MYPWISRTLDFGLQFCEKKCGLYMDVYGKCNLFTHGALWSSQELVQKCPCIPKSNWNLEMLVFKERGKPEYPEKNHSEQSREPTTNSTHIWRGVRESNLGHIGGRRAHSPLRHSCSPVSIWSKLRWVRYTWMLPMSNYDNNLVPKRGCWVILRSSLVSMQGH